MSLNKADIFACDDMSFKVVQIPKWGDVRIKVLSIHEQLEFEKVNKSKKDDSELMFHLLMFCCVDDNGNHLFDKGDFPALAKKSSASVLALFKACLELNSMHDKALDEQAKNS